jgi:hypothetical protein
MGHEEMSRGYRRRLEYLALLVFLVMILVASIHQGQTGSTDLAGALGEPSRSYAEPRPTTWPPVEPEGDESQESIDRKPADVFTQVKALEPGFRG